MDNLSVFWILFSGFILENCSIYKSSTNCFCNGSFSFGNIIMLSFASILFWGLGLLNMDNLSVFWILFSDFIWFNPSINNASIICFFKGSFSRGNISKFSFASIILSGLGVLNIDNLSIFWILFSGFNKTYLSIYKSSTNCFFKLSFSFLTGIISILSLISILFWGFGVLNIDILSTFCILFSDFNNINPSINNASINCFFKGSFSLGNISKFSLASIILWGLGVLNIVILSTFCILFSGFTKFNFSMNKLSTNCFFKGSFSNGSISILSLGSINNFSGINLM